MHQHTLAATYLKGFVSPACPAGQEPFLYLHNVVRGTCKARAPSNVAKVPNYYSYRDERGQLRHEAERVLSAIETSVTPILRRVLPERGVLSAEQEEALAIFVTTTTWRVPDRHDGVKKHIASGIREGLRHSWEILEAIPHEKEWLQKSMAERAATRPDALGGPCTVEELRQMLLNPKRVDFVPKHEVVVGTALGHGIRMSEKMLQRGWVILVAQPDDFFVTTNRPGVMLKGGLPREMGGEPDPEAASFTFPLSRSHCLLAADWMDGRTYRDAARSDVELMNMLAVQGATHVFAPAARFPGDLLMRSGKCGSLPPSEAT